MADGQYERKFAMSLACLLAHSSPFIAVMVTRRKKSTEASHNEREGRSRDEDRARYYEQKRTQKSTGTSLREIWAKDLAVGNRQTRLEQQRSHVVCSSISFVCVPVAAFQDIVLR